MPNFNYLYENIDNKMRNLRFYENDADFKAYEIAASGDGNSIETSIPGVASIWEENKTYYNPHNEEKLTHTLTVNYKNKYGDTIAESDTVEVKYYNGVKREIVVFSKNIDKYKQIEYSKTVTIPENNSVTFIYDTLDYSLVSLAFKFISAGTIYWKASNTSCTRTIEYRKNNGDWTSITSNTGNSAPSISVNAGDIVQFRGDNATYCDVYYSYSYYYYNSFSGSTNTKFEVEGNIMALISSTGFTTATTLASSYTFYHLFGDCTSLTSTENLVLPATTLVEGCYDGMFMGCTSLATAPALPATTLAQYCYSSMFEGCTSLTTAPSLHATTLASFCYYNMFNGCTSLTTAPALPVTTLSDACYISMFCNCTSLTTAPELPATKLANNCYGNMFNGCTSLITAPVLPATTLKQYCYVGMFSGCTSLTTVPELPATTLANYCYRNMFYGCTSLNYIKCLATNISATNCTSDWIVGVASSGTFVKNPSMSSWGTGTSGIPSNWTVQDA